MTKGRSQRTAHLIEIPRLLSRPYQLGQKNVNEEAVLDHLKGEFDMAAADLHERVKKGNYIR